MVLTFLSQDYDQSKLKKGCSAVREQVFWEAMNLDSWQVRSLPISILSH